MANQQYAKARRAERSGDIDWVGNNWRVYLVDTNDYAVDIVNDEFLSDIPSGALVAYGDISGKTITAAGILDANDTTLTGVSGDISEALVVVQWSGSTSTSRLYLYIDTGSGLPFTPNGGNLLVQWSDGANKILN